MITCMFVANSQPKVYVIVFSTKLTNSLFFEIFIKYLISINYHLKIDIELLVVYAHKIDFKTHSLYV